MLQIGADYYLRDSLTRADRHSLRVIIVGVQQCSTCVRYWVTPVRRPQDAPFLVRESALSKLPDAAKISSYDRARWARKRFGDTAPEET